MASDLHAFGAQLGNDHVDALLLDGAQRIRGDAQAHPALLALEPEPLRMQVRQEAATLLVVGVRDAISGGRPFAGDFTDAGHRAAFVESMIYVSPTGARERARLYISRAPDKQPPKSPRFT